MNEILHQAMEDLRHVRWLLLPWLALVAAGAAVHGLKLDAPFEAYAAAVGRVHAALVFAAAAVSWLLALRVIQAPLAASPGPSPAPRLEGAVALLVSRLLLLLALFVLVPAGAQALAAAANGVAGADLAHLGAELALVHAASLLVVATAAALTRSVGTLAVAAIGATAAWATIRGLAMTFALGAGPDGGAATRLSGLLAGAVCFVVVGLAVFACQCLARRPARTILLAAAGSALAIGLGLLWPWDIVSPRPPVDPGAFDAARVTVSVDGLTPGRPAESAGWTQFVRGRFHASGMPPGWMVLPLRVSARLAFPDGAVFDSTNETGHADPAYDSLANEQALVALASAAGGRWLNDPWSGRAALLGPGRSRSGLPIVAATLPGDAWKSHAGVPADYRAEILLGAFQVRVAAAVALRPGASGRAGSVEDTVRRARFTSDEQGLEAVEVAVRDTRPALLFRRPADRVAYVLRNRARGELLFGLLRSERLAPAPLAVARLQVTPAVIWFPASGGQPLPVDDAWLSGAELLMIAVDERHTFSRAVHVPGISLAGRDAGATAVQ